jgi:hypothetical protein
MLGIYVELDAPLPWGFGLGKASITKQHTVTLTVDQRLDQIRQRRIDDTFETSLSWYGELDERTFGGMSIKRWCMFRQ